MMKKKNYLNSARMERASVRAASLSLAGMCVMACIILSSTSFSPRIHFTTAFA